jgi:amidase
MKRIPRERALGFLFCKDIEPVLRVQPNESFIVETEDNVSGCIQRENQLATSDFVPGLQYNPAKVNPIAGPIYIEGAKKGDLLAIHIEQILPSAQGHTFFGIRIGPLDNSIHWPELTKPHTHILKHIPGPSGTTADGTVIFNDEYSWPIKAFIGTIGTAPEWEAESSVAGQGPWGGNIDVRDICAGNIVYLNCYNDGGLLFLGDVHGSQADTEFYGTADECRAEVKLRCEIIRNKRLPGPRIETDTSIITLCSDKPLEAAVTKAMLDLMECMVFEYGIDSKTAYMFTTINPHVRAHVYQMVPIGKIRYTAGVEIPKKYLESSGKEKML